MFVDDVEVKRLDVGAGYVVVVVVVVVVVKGVVNVVINVRLVDRSVFVWI